MALILTKVRLNEFVNTGEVREEAMIFEEFNFTQKLIDNILIKEYDKKIRASLLYVGQTKSMLINKLVWQGEAR